jgi:hypothetical protein
MQPRGGNLRMRLQAADAFSDGFVLSQLYGRVSRPHCAAPVHENAPSKPLRSVELAQS